MWSMYRERWLLLRNSKTGRAMPLHSDLTSSAVGFRIRTYRIAQLSHSAGMSLFFISPAPSVMTGPCLWVAAPMTDLDVLRLIGPRNRQRALSFSSMYELGVNRCGCLVWGCLMDQTMGRQVTGNGGGRRCGAGGGVSPSTTREHE